MKQELVAVFSHNGCIAAAHQIYTASVTGEESDKYFITL